MKGFTKAGSSPILVPSTLAANLLGEAMAAGAIWECIQSSGRPDSIRLNDKFVDDWTPAERGEPTAPAPPPDPPPKGSKAARRPRRNQVQIYELAEVEAAKQSLSTRIADRERIKQRGALFDQMLKTGPTRNLAQPKRSWPAQLDALAQTYPNFSSVVDYLRAEFALRAAGGKPLGFAPLVVYGPPGIGKSVFMESLALVLCTKFHRVQCETAQHSSCLVGTDKHWANSEAGVVFNSLVLEGVANPVIYIDEVDKTGQDSERSITSALYGLLEEGSAKAFRDASMPEVQLNASHLQWLFAANDIKRVPAAIRSRWTEFEIPPMNREDARRVVQQIYGRLQKEFGIKGLEPLAEQDLDLLAIKAPREMRALLRRAMARAVQTGKKQLDLASVVSSGKSMAPAPAQALTAGVLERGRTTVQEAERLYLLLDTALDLMTGAGRVLH